MKKIPTITVVLCVVSVGMLSGCMEDILLYTPEQVYNTDQRGEFEQGDVLHVEGIITKVEIVGGAGRAMLDDILEISYSMGSDQGNIYWEGEGKEFYGRIIRGSNILPDEPGGYWYVYGEDFVLS